MSRRFQIPYLFQRLSLIQNQTGSKLSLNLSQDNQSSFKANGPPVQPYKLLQDQYVGSIKP